MSVTYLQFIIITRLLKGKESKEGHNKQTENSVNILNEEKKILQLKLSSNEDRHLREVSELKTKLESLQSRYNTIVKRLEMTETANQKEILALKKSLSAIERENENQKRELETLYGNLEAINKEKENIKNIFVEKNTELSKWKKEALNGKAEIKFLRGSLNILEKEGLTAPLEATRDTDTSE